MDKCIFFFIFLAHGSGFGFRIRIRIHKVIESESGSTSLLLSLGNYYYPEKYVIGGEVSDYFYPMFHDRTPLSTLRIIRNDYTKRLIVTTLLFLS
jgi:hypothetical protein